MRAQEAEGGPNTEETELDQPFQNILEEEEVCAENYDTDKQEKARQEKFTGGS